ncbi:hypothetical protein BJ742DRAFT_838641 [Cladochytrium replicatum]|nr:hypothetical protein BJ742DRAFT_838641 [Cladochytrium replicatum]
MMSLVKPLLLAALVAVAAADSIPSTTINVAPGTTIKRQYSADGAKANIDFVYKRPTLDLDALSSADALTTVSCNPLNSTLTFKVAPSTLTTGRQSPSDVARSVNQRVASSWYTGMGVKLETLDFDSKNPSAAACLGMRYSSEDPHVFRTVKSYTVTPVADGAEVTITTAPANQTDFLQRVVADLDVAVGQPQSVASLTKRADAALNILNLNWNNAAHAAGAADSKIPIYSKSASAAGGTLNGQIDVSCSNCYFWIEGKLKIHIDTGVFGEKVDQGTAEFYAFFEGSAEVMAELEVAASGTFSNTWSKNFFSPQFTYSLGGVLNLNAKVGVLLAYTAALSVGNSGGVVRVGERFRLNWGVPIDFLNGKGKLPAAYSNKISETTGYASILANYNGEAIVSPVATFGVDLLSLAGIDLTLAATGTVPHSVSAYANAGTTIIWDGVSSTNITAGAQCGVTLSYGCSLVPSISSNAFVLGMQFSVYEHTFPDVVKVNGELTRTCVSQATTVTIPPASKTSSIKTVTSTVTARA